MKIYVASALENIGYIREVMGAFRRKGHEITYDWTEHGSVQESEPDVICDVAGKEVAGIAAADVVLVVLPGGRGTHIELGIAVGLSIAGSAKQIIVAEERKSLGEIAGFIPAGNKDFGAAPYYERTCAFYHYSPTVLRVRYVKIENLVSWVENLWSQRLRICQWKI